MPLVVVLRFGSGIRVDIVGNRDPKAAIADFAGRCLSSGAELPLIEAVTCPVSDEAIAAIWPARVVSNGDDRQRPATPALPVSGLARAVGRYVSKAKAGTDTRPARDALSDFFTHYDVTLNFDGEP